MSLQSFMICLKYQLNSSQMSDKQETIFFFKYLFVQIFDHSILNLEYETICIYHLLLFSLNLNNYYRFSLHKK